MTTARARFEERAAFLALYERIGFATVPLGRRGKKPLRKGWQNPTRAIWDGVGPDANVGVVTGEVSGNLLVHDFDSAEVLQEVMGFRARELAVHTPVVVTSRGWHVYTTHEEPRSLAPREGYSVQGTGSLVVAPPSVHRTGHVYRFLAEPRRVAPLRTFLNPDDLYGTNGTGPTPPASRLSPNTNNTTGNTAGGGGGWAGARRPNPAWAGEPIGPEPVDLAAVEAWVLRQAPRLRELWAALKGGPAPPGFDRSGADFAIARCLWEGGFSQGQAVGVLLQLPGSKANDPTATLERRRRYASGTARAAYRWEGRSGP